MGVPEEAGPSLKPSVKGSQDLLQPHTQDQLQLHKQVVRCLHRK